MLPTKIAYFLIYCPRLNTVNQYFTSKTVQRTLTVHPSSSVFLLQFLLNYFLIENKTWTSFTTRHHPAEDHKKASEYLVLPLLTKDSSAECLCHVYILSFFKRMFTKMYNWGSFQLNPVRASGTEINEY